MELPTKKSRIAMAPKDNIIMVYGPPGVGKTSFINGLAPRVLFLSTDRGTRHLDSMRIECLSWKAFTTAMKLLKKPDAPQYDIICIDHVDDWAGMSEDATCMELGVDNLSDAGYGKGWKAYKRKMMGYVREILNMGAGVAFIAHEDQKKVKLEGIEQDRFMPEMSKSAWKVMIPPADIVGYCGFRRLKDSKTGKKKEVRTIQTQPTREVYAKDRTRRTKPESGWELLDAAEFIKTFESSKRSA